MRPSSPFYPADKGVQTSKRELTLVDRSNSSIRLTLWGKQAETYEGDGSNPVIAFKGVRVSEFQGKTRHCFILDLRKMLIPVSTQDDLYP